MKVAVVDAADDFTKKGLAANYKPKGTGAFCAKTKLISLATSGSVQRL